MKIKEEKIVNYRLNNPIFINDNFIRDRTIPLPHPHKPRTKRKKNLPNNMTKLSTNSDESDNTIKSNDLTKIGIVSVLLILSKLCYGQWHCTGCEKTKKRARSLRVINLSCWGK